MLNEKCQVNLVKKIGSVAFFSFLFSLMHAAPAVELKVINSQGQELQEAAIGVPFTLLVNIIDGDGSGQVPTIKGIERFVQGPVSQSQKFTMINGATSSQRSYFYPVRCDSSGNYTIGPATTTIRGQAVSSEVIKLSVSDQEKNNGEGEQQCILSVDKQEIFPGEPFTLTTRFIVEPDAQLSQATADLNSEGWEIRSQDKLNAHQEVINGKKYNVIEQKYEIYNYNVGDHIIPSFAAVLLMPRQSRSSFGFFDIHDIFGVNEQVQIQSNVIKMKIKPLPATNETVHGVAVISKAKLLVDNPTAQEGEGMVVKLELEGSGDALHLLAPPLQLPTSLSYYESKSDIKEMQGQKAWIKTFEYIIQGNQAGAVEIPSQSFTFFDYAKQRYKTVMTQPVLITIEHNNALIVAASMPQASLAGEEHKDNELAPLYEGNELHQASSRAINNTVFILIVMMLLLVLCAAIIWNFSHSSRLYYMHDFKQKNALKNAWKRVGQCKKNHEVNKLHSVIVMLFAERFNIPESEVTDDLMQKLLRGGGMSDDKIKQWIHDITLYAEKVYFNTAHKTQTDLALFDRLEAWLRELEGVL